MTLLPQQLRARAPEEVGTRLAEMGLSPLQSGHCRESHVPTAQTGKPKPGEVISSQEVNKRLLARWKPQVQKGQPVIKGCRCVLMCMYSEETILFSETRARTTLAIPEEPGTTDTAVELLVHDI